MVESVGFQEDNPGSLQSILCPVCEVRCRVSGYNNMRPGVSLHVGDLAFLLCWFFILSFLTKENAKNQPDSLFS